jgi:uncharacterized protein YbaA (DUF1428 family)
LLKVIGRGGQATVWQALDVVEHEFVAVKLLHLLADDLADADLKGFEREVKAAQD